MRPAILLFLYVAGVICFMVAPHVLSLDPFAQNTYARLRPPGRDGILGTDGFGRDQLSRILVGVRNTLATGLIAVALSAIIGIAIGSVSVQAGGYTDLILQRIVDFLLGIPFLVICIVLIISMRAAIGTIGFALGIAFVPEMARFSRGAMLPILRQPFIEASMLCGASRRTVLFRHLLPNSAPPIVAQASTIFGAAIMAESALSFLGLGVPPPHPSLGGMLREGAGLYLETAPWLTTFPGIAIAAIVFSLTITADTIVSHYELRARAISPSKLHGNRKPHR